MSVNAGVWKLLRSEITFKYPYTLILWATGEGALKNKNPSS